MLMKLTPGDDLPLKLGERRPRIDELTFTLPGPDCGGVRWIEHPAAGFTDRKHDAAPKPGGIPTKAAVKSEIERLVDKAYEQHIAPQMVGVDPGKPGAEMTATGMMLMRQSADRVMNAKMRALMESMQIAPPARVVYANRPNVNPCSGCGVDEGQKHFLSCWKLRPALLD